jgi:hypothetical protein
MKTPATIRAAVLAELGRRKWTTYRLWKAVEADVDKQSVYNFIGGDTNMGGKSLDVILTALDLTVKRISE